VFTIVPLLKPKHLNQLRQAMRTRTMATNRASVSLDQAFNFFHNKRHPAEMGEAEIARLFSSLATDRHVSASTQNRR
jgi:hypothetical protein